MVLNKSSRVKRVLLAVAIILCAVVTRCECQNDQQHLTDHNFLLVAVDVGSIIRVPLNGEKQIQVAKTFRSLGVEHDCIEGRFYLSGDRPNQILSANYNDTDTKIFIEKDIVRPEFFAMDWISRRLYFADSYKKTIEVASLENPTLRTVVIDETVGATLVAVDPLRSKLYWTKFFIGKTIWCSNLDGTERQELVSYPQISFVRSIKVSTATGELCYVEADLKQIQCIDPSSMQIRTIVGNLTSPQELAITDKLFYWTDFNLGTIESINSNGVRQEPIRMTSSITKLATAMSAVSDKCPVVYSPCAINNGGCPEDTICLVNASAPTGKRCISTKV